MTVGIVLFVTDAFVLGVLVKLTFRDKIADVQFVEFVARLLYLEQSMLRDKAAIRQQRLVNRAHLVYA